MGDTAGMHQLHDDGSTRRMHGIGDPAPARDLLGIEESGDARIAKSIGRGRGALGDDQAGTGALGIVFAHHVIGAIGHDGTAACQRGHDDAVAQTQGAHCDGVEEHVVSFRLADGG